jgi:hypothetical protein
MPAWPSFLTGLITGGLVFKLIDYLIAWQKERREQKGSKTSHEKDRPRFRIDITKVPTDHALVPAAVVKILSLGSLPLTINRGEVLIEASHYPEGVQSYQLRNEEISSIHPIEFQFSLPSKLTHPVGIGEPTVKMVCKFSYGKAGERYEEQRFYNHRRGWFD